jgi:Spy/CpxP family protein refolding chaperone
MSRNQTTDNPIVSNINKAHMWRMAFFGLIILIAGIAIGGSSILIFAPKKLTQPPPGPEFRSLRMIPPLRRDLNLTSEQADKIKPILDKHMQKLNTIRAEARSEITETLKQMNQEIAAILTKEQQQRWQREINRLQDELRPRGGPGPGRGEGPGGPRFRGGQQERPRRGPGPGPFGPRRRSRPAGPNTPQESINNNPAETSEEPSKE